MAILAIALILLCLSSVSAVEDNQFNSTLETVNDNSQIENIVIDEISDADDVLESTVSVESENDNDDLLKASDDDVLAGTVHSTITPVSGYTNVDGVITATVNVPIYIKMSKDYDTGAWEGAPSSDTEVNVRESENSYTNLVSSPSYGVATSDAGAPITFNTVGTYTFLFKVSSFSYDIYSNRIIVNVVKAGSPTAKETDVTITVPSTGTTGTSFDIPYSVTEKGTTTGVNTGTLTFYDQNGQIGSPISLSSSSGTFSHTYSAADTYNIYAKYTAASGYEDSQSATGSIIVSDSGDSPANDQLTLSVNGFDGNIKAALNERITFDIDRHDLGAVTVDFYLNGENFGNTAEDSYVITFDNTDPNPTTVYVMYNGIKSNVITLNFVSPKSTTVSLTGDTTCVVSETANIIPVVTDSDGNTVTVGQVEMYDARYYNGYSDGIHEILNVGESYQYVATSAGSKTFYVTYLGCSSPNGAYSKSGRTSCYVNAYKANSLTITGNDQSGEISMNAAGDLVLKATITGFAGKFVSSGVYNSNIYIYDNDEENPVGYFSSSSSYNVNGIQTYTITLTEGTHNIFAYYTAENERNDGYAPCKSNILTVNIKKTLPVTITVDDKSDELDITVGYSKSVTVKADTGDVNPELVVYVDGVATSTKISSGRNQVNYQFSSSDYGQHNISVKFSGNDGYAESVSNNVTVNVYKQQRVTPTMTFNVTGYAAEGEKVLITVDTGDAPLNITLFRDSYASDEITHLEGTDNTYEFDVEKTAGTESSYIKYIYGAYDQSIRDYVIYYADGYNYDFSGSFNVARQNTMNITVNGNKDKFTADFGDSVTVKALLDYYRSISEGYFYAPTYKSNITIYMDDGEVIDVIAPNGATDLSDYVLELDDAKFKGVHTIYAVYGGVEYKDSSYGTTTYYLPATSNSVELTVREDKTAAVEVTAGKYPDDVTVKVTSDVAGTYTVDINGTPVSVTVAEGQTSGEATLRFDAETYYANITAVPESDLYNIKTQNDTFTVAKGDVSELKIVVNEISAGSPVKGTIITDVPGTYTVKIADEDPITVEVIGTSKEFETATVLPIGENYLAKVDLTGNKNYNDIANKTTFNVVANAVVFKADSTKKEYTYGEEVILTYELPKDADGEITFTYISGSTGEVGKITVPADTQLSLGTALDAKEYSIQASYNGGTLYSASTKTVSFKVTPKANDVTVKVENVEYGKDVTVELANAAEGTYTVTVNGNEILVTVDATGKGSTTQKVDLAVKKGYEAAVSMDNDNYITSGFDSFDVTPAVNTVTVTVSPADLTYGNEEITVTVEATVPDVYKVDVAGTTVKVNVTATSNSSTATLSLPVGTDYEAKVAWSNENYTAAITNATFNVKKAENKVTVSIADVVYGQPVKVDISDAAEGTYTVTVNGNEISVTVDATGKGSGEKAIDLAVNTYYAATVSLDNDNYETAGSTTFDVTPAANRVVVEAADTDLPDEVTVNVTADVTGTYRVYVNDTEYVDVTVTAPGVKASASKKLYAGRYSTRVEFSNANYTNDVTEASFTVHPQTLTAEIALRDYNYLDNDTNVYVTFTDSYELTLAYKLEKPDIEFISENIRLYYNGEAVDLNIPVQEGQYVRFTNPTISDSSVITVKLVYQGVRDDGTVLMAESNELTVTLQKDESEQPASTHIKIRDADYPDTNAITIDATSDKVTVRVEYQFERIGGAFGNDYDVEFIVGESENDMGKISEVYSWTGAFQFDLTQSATFTIKAVYTDYIFMQGNVEETSNVLKYTVNFPDGPESSISVEPAESDYGSKVTLSVSGSDGQYVLIVGGKDYDVEVAGGSASVTVDVLAADTYEVEIISKTDATLKNKSTLKVNPISPGITLDADRKQLTYGEITTITAGKNAAATGEVKVFDGDKELRSLENIKLAAGTHTIKAKYVSDANFTDGEAEITINVEKAVNELSLEVTNETYPDNVTITLKASLAGEYTIVIATASYKVIVGEDGVGTASCRIASGNHTSTVNFEDNGNYSANSDECKFEVKGTNVGLNATVSSKKAELGEELTLNTSAKITDAKGKVIYSFDDGTEDVEAAIGEAISYTPKTAGTHTIEVSYPDDGIYAPQSLTLTVEISKKKNSVKVTVDAAGYPSNVTITVEADESGDYIVDINGTQYTLTVSDKTQTKSVLLDAGTYYANVTAVDDSYETVTENTTFEVKKGIIGMEISAADVTLPDVAKITVKADRDGTYTVRLAENTVDVKVENGSGSADIKLDAGSYSPEVDFTDKNYDVSLKTDAFTVSEQKREVEVKLRDKNCPENTTVIFVGDKYESVLEYFVSNPDVIVSAPEISVFINGVHPAGLGAYDGVAYDAFTSLGAISFNQTGKYTVKIQFKTLSLLSEGFDINSSEIVYDITILEKADENASVTVDIKDATYPQKATATVKARDGSYTLTVAEKPYRVEVVNGSGSVELDMLDAGSYTAKVVSDEDVALTNETSFNVVKGKNRIKVEVEDAVLPENVTVKVTADVDGTYTVTVGGKKVTVEVTQERGSAAIALSEGNYYTALDYNDTNYDADIQNAVFKVSAQKIDGSLSIRDAQYLENATVTVEGDGNVTVTVEYYIVRPVSDPTTERIEFSINDRIITVDDISEGNYIKVNVTFNQSGEFAVKADYSSWKLMGSEYTLSSNTLTYRVTVNDIPEAENVTVTVKVEDVKYDENAEVSVNAPDGDYIVEVSGKTYDVTVTNATGSVKIDKLPAGEYDVTVTSKDNAGVSNKTKLNVLKSDSQFDVVQDADKLTVKVSDDATGNVTVTVGNKTYTQPVQNGQAVIDISDAEPGSYDAEISYSGDKNYAPANITSKVDIKAPESVKTPTKIQVTFVSGNGTVRGKLTDTDGKGLADRTLAYEIGGVTNTVKTSAEGSFAIEAGKNVKVDIFFEGDDRYIESDASFVLNGVSKSKLASQFNVSEAQCIETYAVDFNAGEKGKVFQFRLTDSEGNPIAEAPVQFAYKTVILNRTTDENGIVSLGVSTQFAGSYLCALSYLGDEKHNATFVAFNFKLDKKPLTISAKAKTFKSGVKTKKYTITLKTKKCASRDGKVYLKSGKKVTLKINGKTFKAKINAKGKATFKITKLTRKGKYTAVIKYAGDKTYNSVSKKVKITVK